MPLIKSDALLKRLVGLLNDSTHVDIAVAWVGPGLAVDSLLEHAETTETRIAVGLSGNATEPATIRRLMEHDNVELRVVPAPPGGIFHSKFYRFGGQKRAICWIGSANFTRGGFGGNAELMNEFSDRNGAGGAWFEDLWQGLDEDPGPAIAHYEEHYKPPRPGAYRGGEREWQEELPRLQDIDTWGKFVASLHVLDDYCHHCEFGWDVLGETYSYLHTIGAGRELARRENWENFSWRDRNILCGLGHLDDTGEWGLLGNLRGAGRVVNAFTPPVDDAAKNHILEQIGVVVGDVDGDFVAAAQAAVASIRQLYRFGPAAATRFLTLARPDCLVSVNRASEVGLGEFAGLRQVGFYLANNYGALLRKVYVTEWFNATEPDDALEREIWRCRAALVDAFVYVSNH